VLGIPPAPCSWKVGGHFPASSSLTGSSSKIAAVEELSRESEDAVIVVQFEVALEWAGALVNEPLRPKHEGRTSLSSQPYATRYSGCTLT
jgi:hypothetical protein